MYLTYRRSQAQNAEPSHPNRRMRGCAALLVAVAVLSSGCSWIGGSDERHRASPAEVPPELAQGIDALKRGDQETALRLLQPLAVAGDPAAETWLGIMYRDGRGVASDPVEAVNCMKQLNKTASHLAVEFGLHGGTDITGYSLLGHGMEMAEASSVSLKFYLTNIPFISCARKYAKLGCFAGGAFDNKIHFESNVTFADSNNEPDQMLLFDPQTSGGLLLGVPREKLDVFLARARELDQPAWVIGEATEGYGIQVTRT